jgi:CRP/FNR family cyclic AMP-dependent transcriptional regulator
MASKSVRLSALAAVPLFSDCSKRELGHVAKVGHEIQVEAGTVLAEQGTMGREAFVILEGDVAVKRGGRKIATLGAGDVVGELSLLDHGPRTATIECETDADLFVLETSAFHEVLTNHPTISLKLLATLSERIREFDRKYFG